MSITIGGITCEEIVDGFEEGIHDQGPVATKKYLCAWANRYTVANTFLGLVAHTGGVGGSIVLSAPLTYPESQNMFAREIQIEGRGKPTQGTRQLQFPQAVITVNYGVPTWGYAPLPDMSIDPTAPYVYASQELDFSREMVTLPKSSVSLANGHKLKDLPYAFPLAHIAMTLQLHRVPYLPAAAIITASQKPLNDQTFLGCGAGYVMFQGAKSHMEASSDGTYTQALTLVFSYRPLLRWDETFDPDGTSGVQQVRYSGAAILLRSNLATLIPSAYGGAGP